MFTNDFKIAWRNLIKDKAHSFINIIGISLGMAVAMLIGLWIYDELSFNKNFDNYDHIAQVIQNLDNNGERVTWTNVPYPLANELRTNYGADFKHIVMAVDWSDHILTIGDKKLKQSGGFFEKGTPDMFTLQMLQSSRSTFNDPSSIFISSTANLSYEEAYFSIIKSLRKKYQFQFRSNDEILNAVNKTITKLSLFKNSTSVNQIKSWLCL